MPHSRLLALATALILLPSATASAQSVNIDGAGKVTVQGADGEKVVIDGSSGEATSRPTRTKKGSAGTATNDEETRVHHSLVCSKADALRLGANDHVKGDPALKISGSCTAVAEGSRFESKSNAVKVSGASTLALTKAEVKGETVAVHVSGSSQVVIDGATIEGPVALRVTGQSNVVIKNSVITGKIETSGNGKYIDGGGNTFSK